MGYIYLILQVDFNGIETYKIGSTKNYPNFRLKQLKTGNPNKLILVNFYKSKNFKKIEILLHKKYFNKKTLANNEWFNLSADDVITFIENCKKTEEIVTFLKENNYFYK